MERLALNSVGPPPPPLSVESFAADVHEGVFCGWFASNKASLRFFLRIAPGRGQIR